jgi:hypothetical protein
MMDLAFCGQKAVIEVKPSDDSTNVECSTDGIELIIRSGDAGTYSDISSTAMDMT